MTNSTAAIGAAWRLVEELGSIQPGLWFTYLHLILAALFPIYAGSQASLARPTSAAKPAKHAAARDAVEDELAEEQGEEAETEQQMEGLSPWDALTFPLLAGFTLAGLYFILKWLQDPDILNKILNWYFAVFGSFAVARLLSDGMQLALSFVFPARYRSRGLTYQLSSRRRRAVPISPTSGPDSVDSPLPGVWSRLPLGR